MKCRSVIELAADVSFQKVACPTCGHAFNLVDDEATEVDALGRVIDAIQGQEPDHSPSTILDPGSDENRDRTLSYRRGAARPSGVRPRKVGRFLLVESLGAGAFGRVWRAHDPELDRWVAVKIPKQELVAADEAESFFREARAAAQLRHPNIVAVHEVGREGDTIYIVSDLIRGRTLDALIKEGLPTARAAAELCAKVAEALEHAHAAGVIHRDLKPSNIMVDQAGEPILMDFGLARREAGEATLTMEGRILGTPTYMPPEQAAGHGHRADRRSDVYSLGVILYRLLTGEVPFRGALNMVIAQILDAEPPAPRTLNSQVPRDLETICLKCLQKGPDRRYPTATALAADLRRWLAGKPITARPVGRAERLWRWCRRQPVLAGLGALAAALFVTTIALLAATVAANLRVQAELRRSLLGEAVALRQTDEAGRRWKALASLEQAARIRPGPDLRDEYLRCLELVDLRPTHEADVLERPGYCALLAFSADGTRIRYLPPVGHLEEYDARGGAKLGSLESMGSFRRPAAISEDGRLFAALRGDGKGTEVWDLDSRALLASLPDEAGRPLVAGCLAFDRRGDRLAATTRDAAGLSTAIALYDLRSSHVLKSLAITPRWVDCLKFSPDGGVLALSTTRRTESGRTSHFVAYKAPNLDLAFEGDLGPEVEDSSSGDLFPNRIDFGPDGRRMAVAGRGGTVQVWDISGPLGRGAARPKELLSAKAHEGDAGAVRFSPDGNLLLTAGAGGEIKIWDGDSGRLLVEALVPTIPPAGVAAHVIWSPSSRTILCETFRGFSLWEVGAPEAEWLVDACPDGGMAGESPVTSLSFGAREGRLAVGTEGASIAILDLGRPRGLPRFLKVDGPVTSLALAPDDRCLCAAGVGFCVTCDPATPAAAPRRDSGPEILPYGVAYDRSGQAIAAGSLVVRESARRPRFVVRNVEGSRELLNIELSVDNVPAGHSWHPNIPSENVRLTTDGKRLGMWRPVKQGEGSQLEVFEVRTGGSSRRTFPEKGCMALASGPGLSAIAQGNRIIVLDARLNPARVLDAHGAAIMDLAFDGSAGLLAAISTNDDAARIWSAATGETLATLRTGSIRLTRVALSDSGRWLAAGDTRGRVHLWDLASLRGQLARAGLDWATSIIPRDPKATPSADMREPIVPAPRAE